MTKHCNQRNKQTEQNFYKFQVYREKNSFDIIRELIIQVSGVINTKTVLKERSNTDTSGWECKFAQSLRKTVHHHIVKHIFCLKLMSCIPKQTQERNTGEHWDTDTGCMQRFCT